MLLVSVENGCATKGLEVSAGDVKDFEIGPALILALDRRRGGDDGLDRPLRGVEARGPGQRVAANERRGFAKKHGDGVHCEGSSKTAGLSPGDTACAISACWNGSLAISALTSAGSRPREAMTSSRLRTPALMSSASARASR